MPIILSQFLCFATGKGNPLHTKNFIGSVHRLGLFGSYGRNESKPTSDLDFLVEFIEIK